MKIRDQIDQLLQRYHDDKAGAPIVTIGDPVLVQPSQTYDGQLDDRTLRSFVDLLVRTMRNAPGIGVAAPQVGIPLRIAVMEDPWGASTPKHRAITKREKFDLIEAINPRYSKAGDKRVGLFEGCLSFPEHAAVRDRFETIDAGFETLSGVTVADLMSGWQARIFQHEADHPNGELYHLGSDPRSIVRSATVWGDNARWSNLDVHTAAHELGFSVPQPPPLLTGRKPV